MLQATSQAYAFDVAPNVKVVFYAGDPLYHLIDRLRIPVRSKTLAYLAEIRCPPVPAGQEELLLLPVLKQAYWKMLPPIQNDPGEGFGHVWWVYVSTKPAGMGEVSYFFRQQLCFSGR